MNQGGNSPGSVPGIGRLPFPCYHGSEPYIYVSYSHSNFEAAMQEIRRFYDAGYRVWYDEGIEPGGEWSREIAGAIKNCTVFVVLLTQKGVQRRGVMNELAFAMSHHIPVVVIHLEEIEMPPELSLALGYQQQIMKYRMTDEEYAYRINKAFADCGTSGVQPESCSMHAAPCSPDSGVSCSAPQPYPRSTAKKRGLFSWLGRRRKQPVKPSAPTPSVSKPVVSDVRFSAVAPETLRRDEYSVIDVMMYEQAFRHEVDMLLTDSNRPMKETRSGVMKVKNASQVRVELSSPDIAIDDYSQTQKWNGGYLRFQYAVMLPSDCRKKQLLFNADVYIDDVIATKLKFTLTTDAAGRQSPAVNRMDILSAFVSYASRDRSRVASVIQGISKARPDLDIFFDVDNIRSGDNWKTVLEQEIDRRDVLFLFWSDNARKAEWVRYEWHYALVRKGIDAIEPIPLEPPEQCPPPQELSMKHFNDRLLYVINSDIK